MSGVDFDQIQAFQHFIGSITLQDGDIVIAVRCGAKGPGNAVFLRTYCFNHPETHGCCWHTIGDGKQTVRALPRQYVQSKYWHLISAMFQPGLSAPVDHARREYILPAAVTALALPADPAFPVTLILPLRLQGVPRYQRFVLLTIL